MNFYLEGLSTRKIKDYLNENKIITPAQKASVNQNGLLKQIHNNQGQSSVELLFRNRYSGR